MTAPEPSLEAIERYTRLVRGVEKVLLGKANWLVRRTSGLTYDEARTLAVLFAEAHEPANQAR